MWLTIFRQPVVGMSPSHHAIHVDIELRGDVTVRVHGVLGLRLHLLGEIGCLRMHVHIHHAHLNRQLALLDEASV